MEGLQDFFLSLAARSLLIAVALTLSLFSVFCHTLCDITMSYQDFHKHPSSVRHVS